jgi:hypothetical protein
MREEEMVVAIVLFLSIATAISIKVIASAWLKHHENKMRFMNAPRDVEVAARMERMEQALDSIAIEVERISEGQRFTTKLLSEREERARLSS